jgi:hypothetical protein
MAEFHFSTPYIIEGYDVPLRGAPFAPLPKKKKNENMKLIIADFGSTLRPLRPLRETNFTHPHQTGPKRTKTD